MCPPCPSYPKTRAWGIRTYCGCLSQAVVTLQCTTDAQSFMDLESTGDTIAEAIRCRCPCGLHKSWGFCLSKLHPACTRNLLWKILWERYLAFTKNGYNFISVEKSKTGKKKSLIIIFLNCLCLAVLSQTSSFAFALHFFNWEAWKSFCCVCSWLYLFLGFYPPRSYSSQ